MNSLKKYMLVIAFIMPNIVFAFDGISPAEAKNRIGQHASVCGKVSSIAQSMKSSGKPTFLNLGPAYPKHIFTVLIWGKHRAKFSYDPESLEGKNVCVSGIIEQYRGIAQIEVRSERQINLQN